MSCGVIAIGDEHVRFGYSSVADWVLSVIQSFPAPWKVLPLDGKYYGTVIADARVVPVLSFWEADGAPSEREKQAFGPHWSEEAWADYCCDSHWESETSLAMANFAVAARNAEDYSTGDDFAQFVVQFGNWKDGVWRELIESGGGPMKRLMPWSPEIPSGIRCAVPGGKK